MDLASRHASLMVLSGDLGFGMFEPFRKRFPKQFLNVGVAEQNMMGVAAGMAREGRRVVTYSIGNFATFRCLEQIRNDIVEPNLGVTIVASGGGFGYGVQGSSHHLIEDLGILQSLVLSVAAPACDWEAQELTKEFVEGGRPSYLRLERVSQPSTARSGERFSLGKARLLEEGRDVTLVGCGGVLHEVRRAAKQLWSSGVQARVLSLPLVSQLDGEALSRAAEETGGIVTVEEHVLDGGLGSRVSSYLLDHGIVPRCFGRIAIERVDPTAVGSSDFLRARYGLDAAGIGNRVTRILGQRRGTAPLNTREARLGW